MMGKIVVQPDYKSIQKMPYIYYRVYLLTTEYSYKKQTKGLPDRSQDSRTYHFGFVKNYRKHKNLETLPTKNHLYDNLWTFVWSEA